MAMVVVVVIMAQESLIRMAHLVTAFIIMISAIRQDALAAEKLLHR